jgi:hypothetical protein
MADPSLSLEQRMQLLQGRFVEVMQDQLKQDKQVTELQAQLEASRKEVEAGALCKSHWSFLAFRTAGVVWQPDD